MNPPMKVPEFMRKALWTLAVSQAPLLIEGTTRLLDMIRGRISLLKENNERATRDMTLSELAAEVTRLQRRAQAIDDAQLEQIKLIQQIVEQNKLLATSLHAFSSRFWIVVGVAAGALAADIVLLVVLFRR